MVDYSKWNDIDSSDSEDDTQPNIDTKSLLLWRQQAWVERLEVLVRGEQEIKNKRQSIQARLLDIQERISAKDGDEVALKKELEKVENEGQELDRVENDMMQEEKMTSGVDAICNLVFGKIWNNKTDDRKPDENLAEEEYEEFVKENEELCKQYGMLQNCDDSKRFLQEHEQLVCKKTALYLATWCINLEMEEKHDLIPHLAHQCICMQYILGMGKLLNVDPRSCITSFISRIQFCLPEYRQFFETDLKEFKERVQNAAKEKIQEAQAKEEEVRQKRLGPGGLDPFEVYETLPDELKAGFKACDSELLAKLIDAMPVNEANHHMERCVASGLWILNDPDGIPQAEGEEADATDAPAEAATDDATTAATDSATTAATTAATDAGTAADDAKEEPIYTGVSTEDLD